MNQDKPNQEKYEIIIKILLLLWVFLQLPVLHQQVAVAPRMPKTVPTELTLGVKQVPNILNDTAVDANVAAKGYSLVNATLTGRGLTGILKLKEATNIYGYDFEYLNLSVEYQSDKRLNVHIEPTDLTDVLFCQKNLLLSQNLKVMLNF